MGALQLSVESDATEFNFGATTSTAAAAPAQVAVQPAQDGRNEALGQHLPLTTISFHFFPHWKMFGEKKLATFLQMKRLSWSLNFYNPHNTGSSALSSL